MKKERCERCGHFDYLIGINIPVEGNNEIWLNRRMLMCNECILTFTQVSKKFLQEKNSSIYYHGR